MIVAVEVAAMLAQARHGNPTIALPAATRPADREEQTRHVVAEAAGRRQALDVMCS